MNSGIQNIVNGQGITITISGMLIVFAALAITSFFIYLLPFFLRMFAPILPAEEASHHMPAFSAPPDEEVLAAIGFALHSEANSGAAGK
ncbi:MAG: OadG family protein [Candidatus Kuenenia sp.]|nr:OadG family protein [Candidatus Kuenenia hertensis]